MLNQATGKKDLVKALITIVLGLLILGLFIIAFGGHRFWEKLDTYTIHFRGVKNLSVGRPVKYAGIEIGRVLDITVDPKNPGLILVELGIEEGFTVYEGTRASISQKGLVGDNYVLLNLSGTAGDPLPVGADIPPDDTPDLMEVASSMASLANSLEPKLAEIAENLAKLLRSDNRVKIEEILHEVSTLVTTANTSMQQISSDVSGMTRETTLTVQEARTAVNSVQGDLRTALANLNTTIHTMDNAITSVHGDAGETLKVLRLQVAGIGGSVTELTQQLQRDLDYDQQMVEEILDNTAELTHNLRILTQSLKERPWQILYPPDERLNE